MYLSNRKKKTKSVVNACRREEKTEGICALEQTIQENCNERMKIEKQLEKQRAKSPDLDISKT